MDFQKNRWSVRAFLQLMKLFVRLQTLPQRLTPPPIRLLQIGSAFWQSRALYVAVILDIATQLADEKQSAEQIAMSVSSDPDAVYRLLRMLAAMDIFEERSPRKFANNKLSNFLRRDNPQNVRAMILMHNSSVMSRPWYEAFEGGVRTGEVPFRLTHNEELFAYMERDEKFASLFAEAMDSVEQFSGNSFVTDFDWGAFDRLIDIGGSKGSKSVSILKRHCHIRALVVDSETVIREAERYWVGKLDAGIAERLAFQVGDVFDAVPSATSEKDLYFLSAVLHGFDDGSCVKILQNIASAIGGTGARIAVMELVLDESRVDLAGASFDMQMFVGTKGRERTMSEWRTVFDASGLRLETVVNLRTFGKIMVLKT